MVRKISADAETKKLRDRFLRDLEREGERIVKQLSQQFVSDLQSQGSQVLQGLTGGGASGGDLVSAGGLARVFSSALAFAFSRPRTSKSTRETARSKETEQLFRLSRRQLLAEAGVELTKGDKNL